MVVSGQGAQTLVFSHGFGCDSLAWAGVAPAFEPNAKVVLFDHVGSGASDLSAYDFVKYGQLNGYACDVVEIANALNLQGAVFIGHSVSAMIGMLAAQSAPGRFSRMVMVCPSPHYIDEDGYVGGYSRADIDDLLEVLDSNFLSWSRNTAPTIMGNGDRPQLGRDLTESFCRADPAIARAFARATFLSDHRADLRNLQIPTLILQTREDMIAPLEVGAYIQAQVNDSELVVMKATGHCPHMSAPAETVAEIRRFVDKAA